MKTTSNFPLTKVTAGGVSGALVLIIVWLLSYGDIEVPANVAGALVLLFNVVVAYLVPLLPGEVEPQPLQAQLVTWPADEAALGQARAATASAEAAHGRLDDLSRQLADRDGMIAGGGLG